MSRARCLARGEKRSESPARHPSPCVLCPGISGQRAKPACPEEADAVFSFSEGRRSSCSGRSREGPAGAGEAFPERRTSGFVLACGPGGYLPNRAKEERGVGEGISHFFLNSFSRNDVL